MNPLRANPEHKLDFFGEVPRLLEQKVRVPFRRAMAESCGNTHLKFQPILYRRNFHRGRGAEAPSTAFEIPARSSSKLDDSGRLLVDRLIDRLREGASRGEGRYDQYDEFGRVQSVSLRTQALTF